MLYHMPTAEFHQIVGREQAGRHDLRAAAGRLRVVRHKSPLYEDMSDSIETILRDLNEDLTRQKKTRHPKDAGFELMPLTTQLRTVGEITFVFRTWGTFVTCPARWKRAPLISVSVLSTSLHRRDRRGLSCRLLAFQRSVRRWSATALQRWLRSAEQHESPWLGRSHRP